MTREPLMLSDTAMVLLREYVELKEHFMSLLHTMTHDVSSSATSLLEVAKTLTDNLPETNLSLPIYTLPARIEHVEEELLQELWLLWSTPDVVPTRQLDWHIVFDEALMAAAEKRLASRPEPFRPPINPDAVVQIVGMRELETQTGLINQLENAYKVGLATRKTPPEKDQP